MVRGKMPGNHGLLISLEFLANDNNHSFLAVHLLCYIVNIGDVWSLLWVRVDAHVNEVA